MRRWSALPRPFLATFAGVFAIVAILYGSLWMYAVRYPGPVVELGFNQAHNPDYDAETPSLSVDDVVWISAPLVKRGTALIDRAFFRSAYDARVILQDLAEKTRTVSDRRELAMLLENTSKVRCIRNRLFVTWKPEMETSPRNSDQCPGSSTQFRPHYLGQDSLSASVRSSFPESWTQFQQRCRCSGRSRSAERPGTSRRVTRRPVIWGRLRRSAWCLSSGAIAD